MIENQVYGKLLPTHEDIMPILEDIREKYQIPEISPTDDGMEILLRHELEFDWIAIHAEILKKLKEAPDIMPEKVRNLYEQFKKYERDGIRDPELDTVSEPLRDNIKALMNLVMQLFAPTVQELDSFLRTIADLCIEYLITGEAREVPENWFCAVNTMDSFGETILVMQANAAVDPDEAAEMFKKKFKETYGKRKVKLTEKHVKTADYLRMKWEGKSYLYILEEMELRDPKDHESLSNRHPASVRKKNDRIRQRLSRMKKELIKILS